MNDPAHASSVPPPTPPRLADRYRFVDELGAGTQGRTYRAVRLDDERPVAIKVLHLANVDNWKAVELFEREAKALGAVDDIAGVPDLVEYIADDPGTAGDPVFYLVQELIVGESIAERLERGHRFTEGEVVTLAHQVLDVLEELHSRTPPLIHRDIKPENIILRPPGSAQHPLALVDFGAVTDAVASTAEGSTVAGTVGYMAPEQFQGTAVPASDIYGLGTTMVHMLSGVSPAAMETTVFRLEFEPHVAEYVSPSLISLLRQMLAPDHAERIGSAAQVRDALDSLGQLPAPVDDETEALAPASDLSELEAAGQPGAMTLFHAVPKAPRKFPMAYRTRVLGRYFLYIGGGFLAAAIGMFGALAFLGLGAAEASMFLLVPPVFGYWLYRGNKTLKDLIKDGHKAVGIVDEIAHRSDGYDIHFSFEVGGAVYDGVTKLGRVDILYEEEDEVGVLYDPEDPSSSTLYPIPPGAYIHAAMRDRAN